MCWSLTFIVVCLIHASANAIAIENANARNRTGRTEMHWKEMCKEKGGVLKQAPLDAISAYSDNSPITLETN